MMRAVAVVVICCLTTAFGIRPKQDYRLIGRWTEHWGTDTIHPETDVKYVDTITIANSSNGLEISCHHDHSYSYDKIRVSGDSVYFRMRNSDSSTPERPFYVNFRLRQVAPDRMEGRILNSNDETVEITLKKLPLQ